MTLQVKLDEEGYLYDLSDWNTDVAEQLAAEEGLELTAAHWELIGVIRDFYQTYEHSPAMRPLIKAVGIKLGADKAKSIYLMQLFPGSPAKRLARIAGLPKPANCL